MSRLVPNSTQVPNILIDAFMPVVSPATFKLLMCVCRQTYGWHKDEDQISLTQLESFTGLSRRCVIDTVKILCDSGVLLKGQRGEHANSYSLDLSCDIERAIQTIKDNGHSDSKLSLLPQDELLVNSVHQQQETECTRASELSTHTKETNQKKLSKENPLPPFEKQVASLEDPNQNEMDKYSAAQTLGMLIGYTHGNGKGLHKLTCAIDLAERRWPDKKRMQVITDIHELWKEYCAQGLHAPVAIHNWLDGIGTYIDSDHWKKNKKPEFVPEIDWQGGHVAADGVYVNKNGKRVPGFICPPKPKEMAGY